MAGPTLDTQAPLMRRKALISRLMSQLQGGQGGQVAAGQLGGQSVGRPVRNSMARFALGGTAMRPDNLGRERAALAQNVAQPFQAAYDPVEQRLDPADPVGPPPPASGPAPVPQDPGPVFEPPAPTPAVAQTPPGFVSQEAYETWNSMDEAQQAQILNNPVARRRYFL